MTTIQYVNQENGGFLEVVEIPDGTTIQEFLGQRMPDVNIQDFSVQVNRDQVPGDHVLQPEDRVTVAPMKVAGA